jgi:hypothetical protein
MAALGQHQQQDLTFYSPPSSSDSNKLLSEYLGISFSIFLTFLPESTLSFIKTLQSRNKSLSYKLFHSEQQLKELYSRRKEDSKANARVVEIFASHRHAWQQEEKRLLRRIDEGEGEISRLRERVEDLERIESELKSNLEDLRREVGERDEMMSFMARREGEFEDSGGFTGGGGDCYAELESRFGKIRVSNGDCYLNRDEHNDIGNIYGQIKGFNPEFSSSVSKFLAERANLWQDVQYESLESMYHMKHFVARRESPWKVDGESTGVSAKLKLLEQELLSFERVGKSDLSKVPSLMRKQAKRYQSLAAKIDDLCQRMQASDPCEPTLSPEFRTQRQSEFLLEAFRLQQRASETGQKLLAIQTETGKSYFGDELEGQAKLTTRRCMESIRNSFKEIQRNLEIWLARIIGDVEGILARDGASRVKDYYVSRYPFVQ